MIPVKPKKSLGQHFLTDKNIARKITSALSCKGYKEVLEIGPGMGVLTELLLENKNFNLRLIEIDSESVDYLRKCFPGISDKITQHDFLKYPLVEHYSSSLAIIGNFPYNISSQIFFKILENKHLITEVVCMLQKEVAERIASPPGSKVYGILSVLLQAFYKTEFLFNVEPSVFIPPPRIRSSVVRLIRRQVFTLDCNEQLFFRVVKTAFNQRRKMLHNSLASFLKRKKIVKHHVIKNGHNVVKKQRPWIKDVPDSLDKPLTGISEKITVQRDQLQDPSYKLLSKRPEQLSVNEFVNLTNFIESSE